MPGTTQSPLAYSQQRMQDNVNKTHDPAPTYRPGDTVWLDLEHIPADRPSKKLDSRYARYQVLEAVGGDSYRLNTPPGAHNVFHVDRLHQAPSDPLLSQQQREHFPPPVFSDEFHADGPIERILQERKRGRGNQVLVQWADSPETSWEPTDIRPHRCLLGVEAAKHGMRPPKEGSIPLCRFLCLT